MGRGSEANDRRRLFACSNRFSHRSCRDRHFWQGTGLGSGGNEGGRRDGKDVADNASAALLPLQIPRTDTHLPSLRRRSAQRCLSALCAHGLSL